MEGQRKIYIEFLTYPYPDKEAPEYVKEAYVGLCVESWGLFPGPNCFGEGNLVYLVYLSELLRKLAERDQKVYQLEKGEWGDIDDLVTKNNEQGISLVFPANCCREISTTVN